MRLSYDHRLAWPPIRFHKAAGRWWATYPRFVFCHLVASGHTKAEAVQRLCRQYNRSLRNWAAGVVMHKRHR